MPVSVRIHAPAALTWLQAADADILDIHTRSLRRWRARYVVGGNANPSVAGTAATSTYARRDHGVTLSYRCVWLALGLGLYDRRYSRRQSGESLGCCSAR